MKTCAICGARNEPDAPTCVACGEASWQPVDQARVEASKADTLAPPPPVPDEEATIVVEKSDMTLEAPSPERRRGKRS